MIILNIVFFCEKQINDNEIIYYNEDGESCHKKCLYEFEKFWENRDNAMDMMGW